MFSRWLLAIAAVVAQCLADPSTHSLHERSLHDPVEYVKRELAPRDDIVPIRIGLTQRNLEHGDDLLHEIGDPNSGRYGKHLTPEEIVELFAPHDDTVAAVKSWLVAEGIEHTRISLSANKQWLQFDGTTVEVESLLKTTYHVYEHNDSGNRYLGTDEYHLPHELVNHIDYITPGVKMLQFRNDETKLGKRNPAQEKVMFGKNPIKSPLPNGATLRSVSRSEFPCYDVQTPQCIRKLYGIPKGTSATPGNELGIYETLYEHFRQKDLNIFFKNLASYIPNATEPVINSIDGGTADTTERFGVGLESQLDLDVAFPIIHPQKPIIYQVDDDYYELRGRKFGFLNTFLDALDGSYCTSTAFGETGDNPKLDFTYPDAHKNGWHHPEQCGVYKPANVISISYGADEHSYPVNYQRRQCKEFMKLSLQGSTIVAASGDAGVSGNGFCIGRKNNIFAPTFPVSCPYVLSVGSTKIRDGKAQTTDNEIATWDFYSGSGFSNIFPTPKYQNATVHKYLKNVDLTFTSYVAKFGKGIPKNGAVGGRFNRAGRAYPDVAALGLDIAVYAANDLYLLGGTSASSPLVASILTRINEERLAAGKSTVGFIHPIVYQHPELWNDITFGRSAGCRTNGFPTAAGWDPVTGVGSPNYSKLLNFFMSLP